MPQNVATYVNQWPTSLASHMVISKQLSDWPSKNIVSFKDHQSTSGVYNRPQKLASVKAVWLTFGSGVLVMNYCRISAIEY